MLKQLSIKNLAIIDDITIDFEKNLNVLTGETGAGKSIIIDAIGLIFGKRADNDIIASGKDQAIISAALDVDLRKSKYILDNFDIDVSDEFIITRILSNQSKSVCKINGQIVPLHILNEISNLLIDISSQNESQFLFNKKNHLQLLDSYIENYNSNFKNNYHKLFKEYVEIKKEYDDLISKSLDESELEFLEFKVKDLKDYNYTIEDEDNINQEYKDLNLKCNNKILFEEILNLLSNDQDGANIKLYEAIRAIGKVSTNKTLNDYYEKFNSIYIELDYLIDDFKKEFANDEVDSNRLEFLSDEITKINRLKRKYNVENLLEYKNKINEQIEEITNKELIISKLNSSLTEAKDKVIKEALNIQKIRKEYSIKLANEVIKELNDLYLLDSLFKVNFEKLDEPNKDGIDDIEFFISTNKGFEPRSLIKVASGGEASRLMLGLKTIFTKLSLVDIIIFDEIDSGVSGKVALSMGKKMESIAKDAQVLAITHLPQVAAMSDHHYYISKKEINGKTTTSVLKLDDEMKLNEVARLLSGTDISDSFIQSAKELIKSKGD